MGWVMNEAIGTRWKERRKERRKRGAPKDEILEVKLDGVMKISNLFCSCLRIWLSSEQGCSGLLCNTVQFAMFTVCARIGENCVLASEKTACSHRRKTSTWQVCAVHTGDSSLLSSVHAESPGFSIACHSMRNESIVGSIFLRFDCSYRVAMCPQVGDGVRAGTLMLEHSKILNIHFRF